MLGGSGIESVGLKNRQILALYASLDDDQRSKLVTDDGLSVHGLSAEQWAIAQKLITAQNAAFLKDPASRFYDMHADSGQERQDIRLCLQSRLRWLQVFDLAI